MGERTALNLLQRMTGIATLSRRFADQVPPGSTLRVTDTRKTTPGLRALERYAVRTGGAFNHRDQLGSAILVESALAFLGLGVPEPHPSWGRMLSESGAEYVRTAPWLVIFPGVAISAVVFGTNLLGDAIRDVLDPRQRQ